MSLPEGYGLERTPFMMRLWHRGERVAEIRAEHGTAALRQVLRIHQDIIYNRKQRLSCDNQLVLDFISDREWKSWQEIRNIERCGLGLGLVA
jgi:hypothetical protein